MARVTLVAQAHACQERKGDTRWQKDVSVTIIFLVTIITIIPLISVWQQDQVFMMIIIIVRHSVVHQTRCMKGVCAIH